jgi:hypothetical protein
VIIDNRRAAHLQAILRQYERVKTLHPAESADERKHLRQALIAAQAQHDASTDDEERLDVSKRILVLAQRFKLVGGNLNDIPGHEQHRWTQPWKGSRRK